MNHKITITTVDALTINKALRMDLGNDIDNDIALRLIEKINDVVAYDLAKQKLPTDLNNKCGSCKWAKPRKTHCMIDCTCPQKEPNWFARTNKACKKYEKVEEQKMSDVMPIEQAEFIDNLQRWFNESTNMCHEDCYRFAFIVWQHKDYLSKVLGAEERAKVLDEVDKYLRELSDIKSGCGEWIEKHDEKVRADERANVLEEVKNSIHTIYSQDLHCKADMCERETMGYDCEDCLATFLMGYIEDVMKSHK